MPSQMQGPFVARPRDETLESILSESFAAMEHLFAALDKDKAGLITFAALQLHLTKTYFPDREKLGQVFKAVDENQTGTLDFTEFVALLYLWTADGGSLASFWQQKQNVDVITDAFVKLEQTWIKYDADKSRKLSYDELTALISKDLPNLWDIAQGKVDQYYPVAERQGKGLRFPKFVHLLYAILKDHPANRIPGNFMMPVVPPSSAGGKSSPAWELYSAGFKALENDFARLDTSGEGFVDFSELTKGMPLRPGADRLFVESRLQYNFSLVDQNGSHTLDFFEFVYLAYLMCFDGSYADVIQDSSAAAQVYRTFQQLTADYKTADARGTQRLNDAELTAFFQNTFDTLPDEVMPLFEKLQYESSSAPGVLVVDIVRMLRLLYCTVCAEGAKYGMVFYEEKSKPPFDISPFVVHAPAPQPAPHPPRIQPVENDKFQGTKKLGQGGQGTVWIGTYNGAPVAGKVMHGPVTPQLERLLEDEVALVSRIDHPHCHFLVGAKCHQDQTGGPLLLTEVCDGGSLFDLYWKRQERLSLGTAWRIARETAAGMEYLHEMGYMHRDLKSLNVFLSATMTAKVADFGLMTSVALNKEPCGTPQWMAPEVIRCSYPGDKIYDRRCDIFSFGVLVWEIYHAQIPYAGLDQMVVMQSVLSNGLRPPLSPTLNAPIMNFIMQCWAQQADHRPQTFAEVIQLLEGIRPTGQ